ncbi:MAG: DUF349 domain-containing protein [Bacteroidales bacterium]|nr:DUF349 domain-containing protein [Bacteroidales bacterium]
MSDINDTNGITPQETPANKGLLENMQKEDNQIETDSDKEGNLVKDAIINSEELVTDHEYNATSQFLSFLNDVDFNTYSKQELISNFSDLLHLSDLQPVKNVAEEIKNAFYKQYKVERDEKLEAFKAEGGKDEDFAYHDTLEQEFKDLYQKYKDKRNKISQEIEKEKIDNLNKRTKIIEEIRILINKEESIEQTFKEFRNLQEQWKNIGSIPQNDVKNVWETYHHNVSKFYDYIKINKELRDLDLKKNLETKISICEQAEGLIIEESIVKAFSELQKLHDQWREIGPVLNDKKEEVWIRFKNATTQINKKHQDYFLELKDQERKNLEAKTHICEKIEEINTSEINSPKDWTDKSKEIIELQKLWRTIGFAPKKTNTLIYDRFREACDGFFNKKRDFFHDLKSEEEINKQKKIDLCLQAESLQSSTNWKETTGELIQLQKEWKTIGQIPKKDSEKLWTRFRAACDGFFNAKSTHFSQLDGEQENNLSKKTALIERLEKLTFNENIEESLEEIQLIQKEWTEIGFIPLSQKDKINNSFRDLLSKKFEELKIDDHKKKMLKYRVKLDGFKSAKEPEDKIRVEKNKLLNKLKTLQSDVVLLENNIGFFANSNKANDLKKDIEEKIQKGKETIETIKRQIRLLDEMDDNK